jgi:hypothetical protein
MTVTIILGLVGDALTFTGGFILALDVLRREQEFRKTKALRKTVQSLKGIKLTQDGITLVNDQDVDLVFIRQSVLRSLKGVVFLTLGFVSLLAARIIEVIAQLTEHSPGGP